MPTTVGGPSYTWAQYQQRVDVLQAIHPNLPVGLNVAPQWWTMQIARPQLTFTTYPIANPPPGPTLGATVDYLAAINIDNDADLEIMQVDWRPNVPDGGAFVILDFAGGIFQSAQRFAISGASNIWALRNFNTGQQLIVLTGMDEGKLGPPNATAVAETLIYNPATNSLVHTGIMTTSHESTVIDFDRDGDEDIIAQNWHSPANGSIVWLRNDGDRLTPVVFPNSEWSSGMSLEVLDLDGDGTWELLIGDAGPLSFGGSPPERNIVRHINADLTTTSLGLLPLPYFERPLYSGLPYNAGWQGNVGHSHDISIVRADIDADGDMDAVMSSIYWNDETPLAVYQILVNNNGVLSDETDTRMFNMLLFRGGSHNFQMRDINGDGFVDIVAASHGPALWRNSAVDNSITDGNEIYVNDGTGHFVNAVSYQTGNNLFSPFQYSEYNGLPRWTRVSENNGQWTVTVVESSQAFSTGPGLTNPAAQGAIGFNEFYYLLSNPDVQQAVANGTYATGLAHYLAVGRAQGRNSFAPNAQISGTAGADTLTAREGGETLFGLGGDDVLWGRAGADRLYGGDGNDTIEYRAGDVAAGEIADGGAGTDVLRIAGAVVDLRGASFAGLERMQFVRLGAEPTLNAMINASQIAGLGAGLVLTGSAGQDSVQVFAASGGTVNTSGWVFEFPGWEFQDYIVYVGENGNESFIGWGGLDIYFGSPGNDVYDGRGAFDFAAYIFSPNAVTADLAIAGPQAIGGNQGSDTFINLEGLAGSQLGDTLSGDAQNNIILSLGGDDTVSGRAGDDDLRGGDGNDRIEGGLGSDALQGEAGADRFIYRTALEGGDTIMDFQAGVDKIEVSAAGFGLTAGAAVQFSASANPTVSGTGPQFAYDTDDGFLYFDPDGTGAQQAIRLATLANRAAITGADIVVTSIAASFVEADDLPLAKADADQQPEVSLSDMFDFGGAMSPLIGAVLGDEPLTVL